MGTLLSEFDGVGLIDYSSLLQGINNSVMPAEQNECWLLPAWLLRLLLVGLGFLFVCFIFVSVCVCILPWA